MPLKSIISIVLFFTITTTYAYALPGVNHNKYCHDLNSSDSLQHDKNSTKRFDVKRLPNGIPAGNCYDINWATWPSSSNVPSLSGTITDVDGSQIGITMSANYSFGTTPSIYTFSRFSGYPATIPNATIPKTEWAAGANGSTDMCFSKKVTNPVLLLSSLGSSAPQSAKLTFSVPYVVLYDGGGMVYNNSTSLTGTEGYTIIMFPGDFTCVNIQSSTPENYTNLTWGIRPQPFTININNGTNTCSEATVTATGGVTYQWDGGDTPNQATNTFHQSGTYLVTVTNASGCVTSASKSVILNTALAPNISAFNILRQTGATVIDEVNKKITLTVPMGTDLTTLKPTIVIPPDATVTPASGATVNFTNPISYVVTNSCSSATYTVTLKVDLSVINLSACPGKDVPFAGNMLVTPPDSYAWQIMQGGVWVNATGIINQANYTVTAPANTSGVNQLFDYRRAATRGGNTMYDSYYHLTITPVTSQNIISVDKQVACGTEFADYVFTGNQPIGYTSSAIYQWQTSTNGITWQDYESVAGQSWGLHDKITAKTWFRRLTTLGSCPDSSNVVTIDYIPGPGPADAGQPVSLCNVTQYNLNANIPVADEVGTWSVTSPAGYSPFDAVSIHDPKAHVTGLPLNSQIIFTWTISKLSCTQTNSASVIIANGINSAITSFVVDGQNAPAVINETSHTITLSVSPKIDIAHLSPIITVSNGTLSPASGTDQDFTGIVNYRLTDRCSFTDYKVTITNASVLNLHACQASTFNILVPGSIVPGGVFQWQIYQNGTWQNSGGDANNSDYVAGYSNSPTITTVIRSYRRQVITGGITSYDNYYDVYFEPPITSNKITADRNFVCAAGSSTINFTGDAPNGGSGNITYQWLSSTDNVNWQNINNATQKDFELVFDGTITMYYSRLAKSATCNITSNSIKIDYIAPVTIAVAGNPQTVCGQTPITLSANAPKVTEIGTWSVVNPAGYDPFTGANVHNPNAVINNLPVDTDIELKWSITETHCSQLKESTIIVRSISLPTVNAGNSVLIDRGASTVLNGSISNGNYTFKWSPAWGLSDASSLHPVASPSETTTYTLTANNGADCSITATVKVIVNNELVVPNTITPNNDGVNDYWTIKNIDDHTNATVQIFDRTGRELFYSVGYTKKWDATYNGKKLPAAVYYYIIRLNDVKIKKAGWVTVIY